MSQNIRRPEVLYSAIVELDCRIIAALPGKCKLEKLRQECKLVRGDTGEEFFIIKELNAEEIRRDLRGIKDRGINSVAVVLAHSYAYHEHEEQVGEIAKQLGN